MTVDLSAITDSLIKLVKTEWATAPIWSEMSGEGVASPSFTPNFTGLAPDAAREQPGPQLSLYLYHVESNNATEALYWQPQMLAGSGQPVRFMPLALDVFYLLFSYSESSYIEEQQALSVAMRIFHDQPIARSAGGASAPWELTLTLEHRSYDELSRLWQATTAPLRMSLVYRAAVVFLDPDQMPAPPRETTSVNVEVERLDPVAQAEGEPVP
jgi:hypothetical protein